MFSISFLFLFLKIKEGFEIKRKKVVIVKSELKEIEEFIDNNISSVNINILCEKFNMYPKDLYELMNKRKPGELIRKKRVALVKKMREEKSSEKEISLKSGFSVNYLRTIK